MKSRVDKAILDTNGVICDNISLLWKLVSIAPILDESIFEHCEEDEIILCLNYDGLYGINNINGFLQSSNPNESVVWCILR